MTVKSARTKQLKKDIQAKKEEIAELTAYIAEVDESEGAILEDLEDWNRLYDQEWALQKELEDLERAYRTRNWTYQDHALRNLISQNID